MPEEENALVDMAETLAGQICHDNTDTPTDQAHL